MSNFKLAIVAGHYINTPGKRCDENLDPKQTREWWLNDRVVDYIIDGLAGYNGIDIRRFDDPTGKKDITLAERTNAANAWKADFYLSIHHNAGVNGGTGGGIVAFVYSNTDDAVTLAWQKELYNALIAKTGLKGNRATPLAKANLHECRETKMPAVLLELGFMDSKTDVPIILTDDFAKKCAEACVEVIVKRAKLTKKTTTTTTQKLYRVRKSKDDAKSQVGAYSSLDNAKEACDKAGNGYKVFDWNYNIVYEYTIPVQPKPEQAAPTQTSEPERPKVEETKVIAVYDLDFPEMNLIVDKRVDRTEADCVKAIKKILSNNSDFDIEIAKAFWALAPKYHIDPMMAIAQSILETGWFKYDGSAVRAEQHNYCGLGVTSNGIEGSCFDTINNGVTAQLQHLFAYGSKAALDEVIVDPRFKYVTRGTAIYWQQLAGRWCCPGYDKNTYDTPEKAMMANNTYGQKIRTICDQLIGVTVTDTDVEKYFPKASPEKNPEDKPVVNTTTMDVVDAPVIEPNTNKIVDVIIQVIKKLLESLVEIFRKGTK